MIEGTHLVDKFLRKWFLPEIPIVMLFIFGGVMESRAEIARQCSALPSSHYAAGSDFDKAWQTKRQALIDSIKDLTEERSQLLKDKSTVGDPGSVRQIVTLVAMVTKTTTDLIQDLMPLSDEMRVAETSVAKTLETYAHGKDVAEIINEVEEHKPVAWITADMALTGLNAMKDLSKNAKEMANAPENLENTRKIILEQLDALDRQLDQLQNKLDVLERANRDPAVDRLFAQYQVVRQMCTSTKSDTEAADPLMSCQEGCNHWFSPSALSAMNAKCKSECTK
jgi:hypothetical protein